MVCPVEQHHWYDFLYHTKHAAIIMVATTGGWFKSLPDAWRNTIAVGSILGFGFGVGLAVSNIYGLPADVASLENRVRDTESVISLHGSQILDLRQTDEYQIRLAEWITCALTAQDEGLSVLTVCGPEPHRYTFP